MKKTLLGTLALIIVVLSISSMSIVSAQDETPAEAVTIAMSDGLDIKGMFYATAEGAQAPAVLLLHQLGGSISEWDSFIPALTEAGYNVLAVDQRGFGETGGNANWQTAETDATALVGWLREQGTVDADNVALVGASIGANVALRVCAADADCHTAIALSPGFDFMGVTTEDAVKAMHDKAIFVVASQLDPYNSDGAAKKFGLVSPEDLTIMAKVYASGTEHATEMFVHPDLIPSMVAWLDASQASTAPLLM